MIFIWKYIKIIFFLIFKFISDTILLKTLKEIIFLKKTQILTKIRLNYSPK